MIHGVQNCKIPAPEHRGFRILDCQRSTTTLNSESPPDPWHTILPVLGSLRPNRLLAQGRALDGLLQEGENSQQGKDSRAPREGAGTGGRREGRCGAGRKHASRSGPSASLAPPPPLAPGTAASNLGPHGGGLGTSSGPRGGGKVRLIRGPSTVAGAGRPPVRAPKAAAAPGELPTSPSGGRRAEPARVGTQSR